MIYPDIYFEPAYASLYSSSYNKVVEFKHENEFGLITNLFIKRTIPISTHDGKDYFDLITPYGYGGPIIHKFTDKEKLIASYMEEFEKFTRENHIVAEFVRFHPIIGNGVDFKEAYDSIFDRKTVGTNLTYEDVIATEFSKHKRKEIKKILKNPDISFKVDENPISLDDFIEIYYSTMDRDEADEYYYFDKNYFDKILEKFPDNIVTCKVYFKDKIIGMGVYFKYGKFLHAHLSGTLTEFIEFSPAYILKYAMALYGKEKGYELIHYGGGSSNSPENGLFKFKKDFGKNTEFDFYMAKKIWNSEVYKELCDLTGADINSNFFPSYRQQR